MVLNSEQVFALLQGDLKHCEKSVQGVDITVKAISKVENPNGGNALLLEGSKFDEKAYTNIEPDENDIWTLEPGVYSFTFNEGVVLEPKFSGLIIQRSSLQRMGGYTMKSWFDGGFSTMNMGTTFKLDLPVKIQKNVRIAQLILWEGTPPKKGYNGQYQNDKQRESVTKEKH